MIVGALGDVVFSVSSRTLKTISNFVWSGSARYATHDLHAGNSISEYTEAAVLTSTSGGTAKQSAEGVINLLMVNLNSGNFGMASAYGWIIFIVIFAVSMFIFSAMKDEK